MRTATVDQLLNVDIIRLLEVPYASQLDNRRDAHRTCNSSSHFMAAKFIEPKSFDSDDEYIEALGSYGDTTAWDAHERLLRDRGIDSRFSTILSYSDLSESLQRGRPIPVGVFHRGTIENPRGEHVLIIIGEYVGGFIGHDPFGSPFNYHSDDGQFCLLPYNSLNSRWLDYREKITSERLSWGAGWGRIFS